MKRMSAGAAFTAFLLAVTLLLLVLTLQLGSSARLVPLMVVVPLTALLMYRLARDVVGDAGAAPNEGTSTTEAPASTRAELAMMAWLLVLPGLTSLVGFIVGPALFVLVWMLWRARERPVYALTAALVTGVGVWLIFERALRVQFPDSLWSVVLPG